MLVDPAIRLTARDRDIVRASQEESFADPTIEAVRAEHPHWHEHDIELKALSARQASRWAVEQTSVQNAPWDVRDAAAALTVPTHVIASDPQVYSIFRARSPSECWPRNPAHRRCRSSPARGTRRTATSPRRRSRRSCAALGAS